MAACTDACGGANTVVREWLLRRERCPTFLSGGLGAGRLLRVRQPVTEMARSVSESGFSDSARSSSVYGPAFVLGAQRGDRHPPQHIEAPCTPGVILSSSLYTA